MALQKTKATRYGVDSTYWKVVRTNIDWGRSKALVELAGYTTKAQRDADIESNIDQQSYIFQGDEFTITHEGNNLAELYAKIKTLDGWTDSVDV